MSARVQWFAGAGAFGVIAGLGLALWMFAGGTVWAAMLTGAVMRCL